MDQSGSDYFKAKLRLPIGWSDDELIILRSTCLAFWMDPRSGFRLRKKINSCCCDAQNPRTHSFETLTIRKDKCRRSNITIRYSSMLSTNARLK